MKRFAFRYGDGSVDAWLDEKNILGELRGNAVPPIADLPAALAEALENPVGSAPITDFVRPGDSVCLVISDMSRFWMRFSHR